MVSVAVSLVVTAETVFVLFVVVTVYDVLLGSNDGVKVNEPIANPDRFVMKGVP